MARANFVKSARKPIYQKGLTVVRVHASGVNKGKEYVTRDRSQPENENDIVLVAEGESYWWWQFAYQDRIISKTKPTASKLTQNAFLKQIYNLQEMQSAFTANENLIVDFEQWKSEVEELRDDQQEKMDNMPESLQSNSPAYEVLEQRYNALEEWCSELDNIDTEIDEDEDADEQYERILEEIQGCEYNG